MIFSHSRNHANTPTGEGERFSGSRFSFFKYNLADGLGTEAANSSLFQMHSLCDAYETGLKPLSKKPMAWTPNCGLSHLNI